MRWSHVISRRVLLTTVLVGITASACKETVTEPIAVASVTVTGGGGTLRLGQSTQLTTTLKSTEGWTLPNVGVTWTSSDAAKATISPSGQVTAVARGPVTLTAAAGGVTGTGAVTVIGVQSIALAPETLSVIVTQTRPMTATTVLDAGVTVTPTWRSLDTTIAKVDTAGRVTAKSTTGLARIEVTAEDKKDTAVVRVIPVPVVSVVVTPDTATRGPGQTVQLTATPKDSIGGTLTGRTVTWSSSDASKATVSSTGLVTGVATGSAVITATIEGKTATSNITIRVPINEITLTQSSCTGSGSQSGNTARLYTTETCQYSATPRDASGNTLLGRNLTWSVSDTTVAKLDGAAFAHPTTQLPTVKLLPQKGGTVTLTVAGEGKSAAITVTVLAPVATVTVSPTTITLSIGGTQQLTATMKDAEGNTLTGRTVSWTSSDSTKARASALGLVTGVAAGSATITATSEGRSETAAITIQSVANQKLQARYSFANTTEDESGNGNHGQLGGGATFGQDRFGNSGSALELDGIDDFVAIPSLNSIPYKPITYSAWIRAADGLSTTDPNSEQFRVIIGREQGCIGEQGALTLYHSPSRGANNEIIYYSGFSGVRSSYSLTSNQWTQIVLTIDELGRHKFYANGKLIREEVVQLSGIVPLSFHIGAGIVREGCPSAVRMRHLWKGSIDDVEVWDKVLTEAEISASYHNSAAVPINVPLTGLIGWWPFSGNAKEQTGTGQVGTVYGAVLTRNRWGAESAAFRFDGIDDRINLGTADIYGVTNATIRTISVWFRLETGLQQDGNILSKYLNGNSSKSNFFIGWRSTQRIIEISGNGTNSMSSSAIPDTGWVHAVSVFDGPQKRSDLYINGKLVKSGTLSFASLVSPSPLIAGQVDDCSAAQGCLPGNFKGDIDDIAIWSRALSLQEIQELYLRNP